MLPLSQVPLAGLATSASTLFDAATSATLAASSTATAGALFPLGTNAKFPSTVLNGGHDIAWTDTIAGVQVDKSGV